MCDAGRIKHHLKYNLWREDSTILMVGYQSQGSPGRRIQDGAKEIKLFGEDVASLRAGSTHCPDFQGHADRLGLFGVDRGFKQKTEAGLCRTWKTRSQSCLRRRSTKNAGSGLLRAFQRHAL